MASLQHKREFQRAEEKRTFERTRPPSGVSLHFERLVLVELFLIEDIKDLERKLRSMFTEVRGFSTLSDDLRAFSASAADLFSGRWQVLGDITRKEPRPFASRGIACMPELPEEISRIEITLTKVLPSAFALSFDIHLTEDATRKLQMLLSRSYLPELRFGGILPTRRTFNSSSQLPSELVMQNEIREFFSGLRLRIEQQLRTKIRGVFLTPINSSAPKMPAIELLSVQGVAPDSSLSEHLSANREWARVCGFTPWRTDHIFVDDSGTLFQWPSWPELDEEAGLLPYRLLSIREADQKAEENRRRISSQELIHSLTSLLSIFGLIETTRRKVESLRILVYKTLAGKSTFKWLQREIRLNDEMQLHRMILRRLQFEMKESKWILQAEAHNLQAFEAVQAEQKENLGSFILSGIEGRLRRVCGHSEVVSREISDYLGRRNLDLTYRLQKRLFRWSAVLGVFTVLTGLIAAYAVVKGWPSVQHFVAWWHKEIY